MNNVDNINKTIIIYLETTHNWFISDFDGIIIVFLK